ncbi:hypothetical protein BJ875DRAFT_386825, partial [Amylocarpus encephaloides]
ISTPLALHYEETLFALSNKRNVLVEKLVMMSSAQLEHLCTISKEKAALLIEGIWTRYLPISIHIRDVRLPKIGEVKRVSSDFSASIWSPDG